MKTEEKIDYHHLLVKLFAKEISENEILILKTWLESDPENYIIFNEENELWQATGVHINHETFNTDDSWKNLSVRVGIGTDKIKPLTLPKRNNFLFLIAAASVAFAIGIGGILLWIAEKTSSQQLAAATTTFATLKGEKAHLYLSDSTEVILNSESKLEYNGQYNLKSRNVKFTGEAFFNVKTNPDKPFVVQLNGINVSATGTRFNISSYADDDRIETTLEQGKIQVSIKGMEDMHLKSGQQVVYFVSTKEVQLHEINIDTYSSWKENKLRFIEAPLEEVLRRIGRKYNATFRIINPELMKLKITATILDEPIDEVMEMLSTISPLKYTISKPESLNNDRLQRQKIIIGKKKS